MIQSSSVSGMQSRSDVLVHSLCALGVDAAVSGTPNDAKG
jgi:hypothetical protein